MEKNILLLLLLSMVLLFHNCKKHCLEIPTEEGKVIQQLAFDISQVEDDEVSSQSPVFDYIYENTKLIEIRENSIKKASFSYSMDRISEIRLFEGENNSFISVDSFEYDQLGRIDLIKRDRKDHIMSIKFYYESGKLSRTRAGYYSDGGLLNPSSSSSQMYEYFYTGSNITEVRRSGSEHGIEYEYSEEENIQDLNFFLKGFGGTQRYSDILGINERTLPIILSSNRIKGIKDGNWIYSYEHEVSDCHYDEMHINQDGKNIALKKSTNIIFNY